MTVCSQSAANCFRRAVIVCALLAALYTAGRCWLQDAAAEPSTPGRPAALPFISAAADPPRDAGHRELTAARSAAAVPQLHPLPAPDRAAEQAAGERVPPRQIAAADAPRPLVASQPPTATPQGHWPVQPVGYFDEQPQDARGRVARVSIESEWNQPPPQQPLPAPGEEGRVTLHLDEVDVRRVLEMFSRTHAVNILVAPGVAGQVTANFESVTLEEALDAVLKLCDLAAHREGPMLFVYPAANYPKMDLQLRVFPLDYASGEELLATVQSLLSDAGEAFHSQIDAANNRRTTEAIVVTDTPRSLQRIEQYIFEMDRAPRQVLIEAHVLEIALSLDERHGINYKHFISHDLELDLTGLANPLASPALFARIGGSQVDALLQWLRTTTDAKTLASPRVMVVNGQKARIQVGEQLGFKVITVTETAAVEEVKFLEVGVVLEVTPQVTRDNRVLMRVKPEVSSGAVNPETLLPEEETRELETDVLLADGQGVVIGGLIQEKDSTVQKKIPGFGDLWLLGKLFQRRELVKERSEIVITLVPRVVDGNLPATEQDMLGAERCQAPLFYGPLDRAPRPEPMMRDPIYNPIRILP